MPSTDINRLIDVIEDIDITSHDILFGRGKRVNNNKGNIFFRKLVSQRKRDYRNGYTPSQRKAFAYQIYDEIKKLDPPGRFLMPTSDDKHMWYNVSEVKAIRKICQALRERLVDDPPDIQTMKRSGCMYIPKVNVLTASMCSLITKNRSSASESEDNFTDSLLKTLKASQNTLKASQLDSIITGISEKRSDNQCSPSLPRHVDEPDMKITLPSFQSATPDAVFSTPRIPNEIPSYSEPNQDQGANVFSPIIPCQNSIMSTNIPKIPLQTMETKPCPEIAKNLDFLSSVVLNEHLVRSSLPKRKMDLPKEQVIKCEPKKRKLETISTESSKKETAKKSKQRDDHYQVLPLAFIGKSFLSSKCSNDSRRIFEELSDLENCRNEDGFLYLPSIVGSLCERIMELERDEH